MYLHIYNCILINVFMCLNINSQPQVRRPSICGEARLRCVCLLPKRISQQAMQSFIHPVPNTIFSLTRLVPRVGLPRNLFHR